METSALSCACTALYGCEPSLNADVWLDVAHRYFRFLELNPSRCVVDAEGQRSRVLKWKTIRSKFPASDHIQSVSCYVEASRASDLMQWTAVATWNKPLHSPRPTVFFGYREDVGAFSPHTCEILTRLISEEHSIGYGIGYERNALKGPEAYALGMAVRLGHTPSDEMERKHLAMWWREFLSPRDDEPRRFRHLLGMHRDVYPVSVLQASHLSQQVDSLSFEQWVQSSSRHGDLHPIGDKNWLWVVDHSLLDDVRETLRRNGLLIADQSARK